MLQAMNTGHDGSLTTIHANTPRDSLTRLESMILMTGVQLPEKAMRFMVSSALDLIVQASRMPDGSRKIVSVSEVVGMEGEMITLQEIFVFEKKGLGENGKVLGRFRATGIRPRFADRLEMAGIELPENLFSPSGSTNREGSMDQLTLFFLIAVFLFAVTLVEMAWLGWSRSHFKERYTIKRRLLFISAGGKHGREKLDLYKNRALNEIGALEKLAYSLPRVQALDRMLLRSGLAINASSFLLASLALGGMGFLAGVKFLPDWSAAVAPGAALLFVPLLWLKARERQALAKFDEQLPESLDLLARSLRSGLAISAGMEILSQEMEEPLRSEFAAASDEINLGLSFREAMENMCERVPSRDLRFFAVAILIQRDTGGNIAEILDQISGLVRERTKFKRHVNTLTAEGRISGVVLIGLPVAMFIYLYFVNYNYVSLLWKDPIGYIMTAASLVAMVIGYSGDQKDHPDRHLSHE